MVMMRMRSREGEDEGIMGGNTGWRLCTRMRVLPMVLARFHGTRAVRVGGRGRGSVVGGEDKKWKKKTKLLVVVKMSAAYKWKCSLLSAAGPCLCTCTCIRFSLFAASSGTVGQDEEF